MTERARKLLASVMARGPTALVFVAMWAVGLAALAAVIGFQSRGDGDRHAQVVVETIRRQVGNLGTVVFGPALVPAPVGPSAAHSKRRLDSGERAVRRSLATLTRLGSEPQEVARLDTLTRRYFPTVERVAALVARGDTLEGAVVFGQAQRPGGTYSALLAELHRASAGYGANVKRSRLITSTGTVMAIMFMLFVFSLTLYRATRLAREKDQLLERSRIEALTDSLTGLPNRRKLFADMETLLRTSPPPTDVALGMFDLDGFKEYNDSFGHPAGDALLARFGERLAATVEGRGTGYRVGGDEFCVVVRGADGDDVLAAAAQALSERGVLFDVRCSGGSVLVVPDEMTVEQALEQADKRLYDNKRLFRPAARRQPREALVTSAGTLTEDAALAVKAARRTQRVAVRDRLEADLRLDPGKAGFAQPGALEGPDAQTSLRESEERYRDLFENAGEPIATADLNGVITEVNRAFERTLGYSRSQLIGNRLSDYVTGSSQELADLARERKLAGEMEVTTYEQVFATSDGRQVTLEVTTRMLRKDGRPIEIQGTCRDVTDRIIAAEELRAAVESTRHLALHDALTGLPNRACFHDLLEEALRSPDPEHGGLVVLLVDLDGFKDVNDSLGHQLGDQLLGELAERLRVDFRADDVVARLGGDEFGILITGCAEPEEAAEEALRRVTCALGTPFDLKGLEIAVEASVGVALNPAHGSDADSLLQHAEIAMSVAKDSSEIHAVYSAEMRRASIDKLTLVGELRRALDQRELVVHYQPMLAVDDGRLVGAEALVRWNHPRRGLVLPGAFVPLIEQTGLITPLTLFVLSEALGRQRAWRAHGFDGKIAVNVSVRSLVDDLLPDKVGTLLEEFGTTPGSLILELTESAILVDSALIRETLQRLRRLGVGISLDDFGVGYSSLAHLTKLPLDQLKIDRSFITNAHAKPASAAIAQSVIELARHLGLEIVAEGVESAADQRFVEELGCDIAQGYHLGRPGPPEQLLSFLTTNTFRADDAAGRAKPRQDKTSRLGTRPATGAVA